MSESTSTWEITEFNGRAGLGQVEADWRRLYLDTGLRTIFLSFEACAAYVENLMKAPDQLRCLRLSDGQRARAICLLEPQVEHRLGRPVPVWGFLHYHDHLNDVLCTDAEARRALVPALVAHLRRHPGGRPLLVLGPVPEGSALWESMRRLGAGEYCEESRGIVCGLDCSMPYEKLMASVPKHFRRVLALARNRLAPLPGARFVSTREPAELEAELSTFLELEAAGWKGERGTALRLRRGQPAFYAGLAATLRSQTDFCEITALYADGRCLASTIGTRTGSTYTTMKISYNQDYGRVSPGQLLLAKVIERCCGDPEIERVDFVSDGYWLHGWTLESVPIKQAWVSLDRWRGRALIGLMRFRLGPLRRFARWLGPKIERLGMRPRE